MNETAGPNLQGALTSDEVPQLFAQSQRWNTAALPTSIDLSAVKKTDSSAIALLLEWQAWAQARGQQIEFLNPPDSLRTIAGLSQVESLLGWSENA